MSSFKCFLFFCGCFLVPAATFTLEKKMINNENYNVKNDHLGPPLSPDDFKNAENIIEEFPAMDSNSEDPILAARLYEGDIDVGGSTFETTAATLENYHTNVWPRGTVPYVISNHFGRSDRARIAKAVLEFKKRTCINIIPRTTQNSYIHLVRGRGCSSRIGMVGGGQTVSLGFGCVYVGIIEHEIMHALGIWHEQSRRDRDYYIEIDFSNIQDGMEHNFYINNNIKLTTPYDLGSVMHYGPYAFAKDRSKPTIIAKRGGHNMGQREGFSKLDIVDIGLLYRCPGTSAGTTEDTAFKKQPLLVINSDACEDKEARCQTWAAEGRCNTNAEYMEVYCSKSCGTCEQICEDKKPECKKWALEEECSNNSEYMSLYCTKSCGVCKNSTAPLVPTENTTAQHVLQA